MRDLRKYWQEIREIEKSLPEFVWLMSLDNPSRGQTGGCIAQVAAAAAARLLHAKSHGLATDPAVQAHTTADAAAKHAERALRRIDAGSGAGDAPDREPTRRFSHVLARATVPS